MSLKPGYKHLWPSLVFLVTRRPRTTQELAELVGCKDDTVRNNLRLLEGEGLVKRSRGPAGAVWTWTP